MPMNFFSKLSTFLTTIFSLLFGKLSWDTPPWIHYLHTQASVKPRKFWAGIACTIAFFCIVFYGYYWYQSLPQPEQTIAKITPPKLTSVSKILTPDNLTIDFGIPSGKEWINQSVSPLSLVGKEVVKGITIIPKIEGKWRWDTDSHLVFSPNTDWPAGQTYTIKFANDFFTAGTQMANWSYSFSTQPFEAAISEFKFYQDPLNPQLRQAIATIYFTFPVDASSLERKTTLAWQTLKHGKPDFSAKHFNFTLTYDEHKRTAYLRSEPLSLPKMERYLELILDKDITPITGPAKTKEIIKAQVLVPDAGSYFKVTHVTTNIVRNQQDRPEQILMLETTLGVTEAQLNKSIQAYLLPKDYPATSTESAKPNYQWKDPGEVTENILTMSKPLDLQAIPTDRDFSTLHSYQYHATTPTYLYLKINKGTSSFGGFTLANDYTAILKVPAYPQEISLLHKGALLALGTEEKLSVLVRGLSAVKFDIARVLPDDINHLITQTNGDFSHPYFINYSFNRDNISEVFSRIQLFDTADLAKEQYTALDLSKYLATKPGGPLGLFLLQARGWDTVKNLPLDAQTNRLILITDLGMIVKDNVDGTHDIFVQSITNGIPVGNAVVSILGKNGIPILTHVTDAQGHTTFPTFKDFTNEREPTVYIAHKGNDVSFIPYNRFDRQLNYSRFDVGGLTTYSENQTALTAYLFSDRGIYRPGETAHIGMIVKQPYILPQPQGLPLEATVIDPRGVTVDDVKMTLNDSGYLTLDFQSNPTSPTGQYLIYLYIVKDNHPSSLIGSTSIQVAEFLPDRMRMTAHLSQEQARGWISPSELKGIVGLQNLYGTPAINHRVSAKILLTPHAVTFREFPDYIFMDPLLNPKSPPKVFTDNLTETRTNDQGKAEFDLKLNRFENATYQLTFFTEGFEAEGGRSVAAQTVALVSPLAYLVGYKPDGDLNYIKQNANRSVHFIAVNPQLQQQSLSNIKIQLFRQRPISTLVKKEDGTYQYQSIIQTTQINSSTLSMTDQGANYHLPTNEIGDFLISIMDSNGIELSKFKYNVVGQSQLPLPKDAELNVKINKSVFHAGEDIEMQITSPYTGTGLITIERDKVYAFKWIKTDTTSSMQNIHIPEDFRGNGYINITFVRDLNSPEIFMSPLSYSIVPFAVTHKDHEIQIDLNTPTLAHPGEPLSISYKTDKPGKIIVFAIDEGILQVTKYQTPNPLKFFFEKHALEVNTLQIVDQILPKFIAERELSAVGGDAGEAALRKNLNPFKRKTDAPVVYWSGMMDTDATPRQLTYQIPDYFNGTLRIMAVAVASDAVGSIGKYTEVRGNFVINPNVPTFIAPGDEFDITASIANNIKNSGTDAKIFVDLNASPPLEIINGLKQTLNIPEGQERNVRYKIRTKSKLGSANLTFVATLGDKSSSMSSTLSVRPPMPFSTSITSGYTNDAKKLLLLDRILYPEYRSVEAVASRSPLILAIGLQTYLNDYPHGCVEQLVSKAFPWLVMANQPWFANDKKSINEKIQQTIQMLSQRQMSNGAFNYWPEIGTSQSNDFSSVYAMHFLTEAKQQGYNVPSDVFSAGISYLRELSTQSISNIEQARTHVYAIYILTRNEIVTTNYLTNLQLTLDKNPGYHWHNDIISAYIAATYQMLKSSAEAEKIIAYYKPLHKNQMVNSDFFNQNTANAQYLYLIARHFPNRLQQLDTNLITSLTETLNNESISTILAGYSSLALASYGAYFTSHHAQDIFISEQAESNKEYQFTSTEGFYKKAQLNLQANKVIFNNPGKNGFFYQLTQRGFDQNLPKAIIKQGIEIFREYRDMENNATHKIHLGDEIIVHIRARSTDNQYHNNIALVDLLPGGFEVMRDSITLSNMDYIDAREDRVIFFGSIGPDSKEIIYRIKATNIGNFVVPPIFGTAMYNPMIKFTGIAENISVIDASK
ncbi:MAG: alpha-2-macroglobulin [Gammaproteobacteria bacterium]|nr:alpha-2-macroglobulin [Gammaproteobacteria bacterium]